MSVLGWFFRRMGHEFQDSVATFLEKLFKNVSSEGYKPPDIRLEVNGVMLNLEVTTGKSGFGLITKVSQYQKRGIPLHAIIVASPETDTEYKGVKILGFDENLPRKLIKITNKVKLKGQPQEFKWVERRGRPPKYFKEKGE